MVCRYGDDYIKQRGCSEYKVNTYGRCKYSAKYLRCPITDITRKEEMAEIMDDLSSMGSKYTWFSIGENNA